MYLRFAWRYFKAKKSANAINLIAWVTVGVIAFATACQILVLSVFNGFEGLVQSLYSSFYTDLKVLPAKGKTFALTPAQLQALRSHPAVAGLSRVAEEKALLQHGEQQSVIYLKGVDSAYTRVTGVAGKIFQGRFDLGDAEQPGLVLGYGIQQAVGLNLDDRMQAPELTVILPKKGRVSLNDPLQSLSEGLVTANGVFIIQQEFDNKYALTDIGFMKQQLGLAADEYSALELRLRAGRDPETARAQLQQLLGTTYRVQTRYEQNQSLYQTMRMEKWFIYAVLTLILIVAAFNMISALTMLVLEKKQDISILQSMGASRGMVLRIFLSEGLLLAGIGAITGIVLALLVCWLQVKYHLVKLEGGTFLIDYFPVELRVSDFLLVSGTAALIAFSASWMPARKAAAQPASLR